MLSPEIDHVVVVAPDQVQALRLLETEMPGFSAIGATSLNEFEAAVLRIRATLEGSTEGYRMLMHPEFG